MRDLQNRKLFKKIIYSKLFILIFFILAGILFVESYHFYQKKLEVNQKIAENQEKLNDTNSLLEKKRAEYEFIQSDRGKEEYYRELMPVARDGEKVIVIYDASSSPITIIPKSNSPWFEFKKKFRYFIENYTNL